MHLIHSRGRRKHLTRLFKLFLGLLVCLLASAQYLDCKWLCPQDANDVKCNDSLIMQALICPTICGFWLSLLVSTDSMASLAPRYSMPEDWFKRKVLKLAVPLNTSGPRTFRSVEGTQRELVMFKKRKKMLV